MPLKWWNRTESVKTHDEDNLNQKVKGNKGRHENNGSFFARISKKEVL